MKPKEPVDRKPHYYMLWKDDDQPMKDHPMHIPAPKLPLPGMPSQPLEFQFAANPAKGCTSWFKEVFPHYG